MTRLAFALVVAVAMLRGESSGRIPVSMAVAPRYPLIAYSSGTTGSVRVDVSIDHQGYVKDANVVDGPNQLTRAARRAAVLWRFASAPSEALRKVQLVFHFSIPGEAKGIGSSYRGGYEIDVFGEEETESVLSDPAVDLGTRQRKPTAKPKKSVKPKAQVLDRPEHEAGHAVLPYLR